MRAFKLSIILLCAILMACNQAVEAVSPPANHNPVANAGPDQVVERDDAVRLSCAGSTDEDGDYLRCEYRLLSGESVAITQLDEKTVSFIAPETATTLMFEVVVWDGKDDGYGYDTVIVSVE